MTARGMRALAGIALAAWGTVAAAQPSLKTLTYDDRIVALCNELGHAVLAGNIERGVALTYPRLVTLIGRDRVADALRTAAAGSPRFKPQDTRCEAPSQHADTPGLRLALVPTMMRGAVPDGTLLVPGHYIAVSSDQGANWTFLFLSPDATPEQLKAIFPDGLGNLQLPPGQKPILLPSSAASAAH